MSVCVIQVCNQFNEKKILPIYYVCRTSFYECDVAHVINLFRYKIHVFPRDATLTRP